MLEWGYLLKFWVLFLVVRTILGLEQGKDCILVGTVYKHMKLKPCVLDEYSKEVRRLLWNMLSYLLYDLYRNNISLIFGDIACSNFFLSFYSHIELLLAISRGLWFLLSSLTISCILMITWCWRMKVGELSLMEQHFYLPPMLPVCFFILIFLWSKTWKLENIKDMW